MLDFSTAVSATAMLIQSVRGDQKLQIANFRFTDVPPSLNQDESRLHIITG